MKELLSPAGNMKSLRAAIFGGADAVYVGMKEFSARKFAHNFTREEIIEAIRLCHLYGVRLYVALNTMIKDCEVDSFLELVDFLYLNGVDAFIIQDFGMIALLLEMYEDIEIHASTQFNNSNIQTINFLKELGVKRVVLARELTLNEIKQIDVDIELEVFIHGALCISYSGNCLFSSMLGSRSANRGECTGCCRLPYELYHKEKKVKTGYLLSTKELNTCSRFEELLTSNIMSFKIEGRMKSPEYVYFITKFYRNIIDGKGYTDQDIETLKILFHREFTLGNLFQEQLMNCKSPNHVGLKIGKVIGFKKDKIKIELDRTLYQEDGIRFSKSGKGMIVNFLYNKNDLLVNHSENICYVKNQVGLDVLDDVYLTSSKHLSDELLNYSLRKVFITMKFTAYIGQKSRLTVSDGVHSITCYGEVCEEAKSSPISKERIKQQLCKLGNTIYEVHHFEDDIQEQLFISIGGLNRLRRECLEKLEEVRCSFERKGKRKVYFPILNVQCTKYDTIIVDNEQELLESLHYARVYVRDILLFQQYKTYPNIYFIEKENYFNQKSINRCLVHEYQSVNGSISDYSFNIGNIYSVYYLLKYGYSCVTLSVELTDQEVSSLIQKFYQQFCFYPNIEVVCLDRVELMLIKGNILDLIEGQEYQLVDFKKRSYPIYFDGRNTHIDHYKLLVRNIDERCNKRYHYKYLK